MGDAKIKDVASQRSRAIMDGPTKLAGWYRKDPSQPTAEPRLNPGALNYSLESSPRSSVVHDFERRLSRNGIKISEATNIGTRSLVRERGGALFDQDKYVRAGIQPNGSHHTSRSEDFTSLEGPNMGSFTNDRKEIQVEALERQLRQAQTEANYWKERSKAQELNLRESYKETMGWRMKYEDLYSAVLQGADTGPISRTRRGATKSLG